MMIIKDCCGSVYICQLLTWKPAGGGLSRQPSTTAGDPALALDIGDHLKLAFFWPPQTGLHLAVCCNSFLRWRHWPSPTQASQSQAQFCCTGIQLKTLHPIHPLHSTEPASQPGRPTEAVLCSGSQVYRPAGAHSEHRQYRLLSCYFQEVGLIDIPMPHN